MGIRVPGRSSWGDDVPDGTLTGFRRALQSTAEETVVEVKA